MKTLFKNCSILLRKDNKYITLENAFLGVNKDCIDYIDAYYPEDKYDVEKDMTGKLLMPGLINAHGHEPMVLLRGVGSNKKLEDWLHDSVFPVEDKLRPVDMLVGSELGILEMLASGTTCFSNMYFFPYPTLDAAARSGIKLNNAFTGICFDPNMEAKDWVRYQKIQRLIDLFVEGKENDPEIKIQLGFDKLPDYFYSAIKENRVRLDLSIHSHYLSTTKFNQGTVEQLKKYNFPIQLHASESISEVEECKQKYGLTPIKYFDSLGVFDAHNAYVAHCVHISNEELKILKQKDATIVYNPSSNMKLGSGVAPITEALELGINVAIGTDGCASNNNLDMFEEMHLGALIASGFNKDAKGIDINKIIDMATINGAKALGRDDTGVLEVGKKADIIALDLSKPHLVPNIDTASLIVYSAHGSDVCMTMVDGKILYEDGKYFTLDKDDIYKRLEKTLEHLYKK